MDCSPFVIGVAGGTGSGKTTLSTKLKQAIADDAIILSHDFYYRANSDIPFEQRVKMNYDHPNAFDTDLLIEDVKRLKSGRAIDHPVYSFVTYTRTGETVHMEPARVIIVEGILIFENKDLLDLMDMKLFVDTDADIRLLRRLTRDVKERGRSLDSFMSQYINTVKPMHEQFVEPSKKYADIIIPQGGENPVALHMLIDHIKALIRKTDQLAVTR
ncbi:uridine kinase [Caproiciproducens sp. CPB-2]|uniref:uridine kinase n=1 Tax=Caproiciproducens sp. CPB-2 TaxID=3030017 RepID=UPI0023DA18A6|nr:uridine kinase [Caproiciproducens sp. CPB-2]MDF1494290.1 uridine kinase [Caproiciproducens sp. CPB-2]